MQPRLVALTVGISLCLSAVAVFLGPRIGWAQEERISLEQRLEDQKAKNDALRARIAELERILATDVCNNPAAATLIQAPSAQEAKEMKNQ
jgi:hypothetical protein